MKPRTLRKRYLSVGNARSSPLVALFLSLLITASCSTETISTATPQNAEQISFVTSDGITLKGHIFGTGDEGVVISHMWRDRESRWFDFASSLSAKGYSVLTYHFRGYGDSRERREPALIDKDLEAAIKTLKERRSIKAVHLIGSSMGGTASIKVAAHENIEGLIALSAPIKISDLNVSGNIGMVKAPKLFIYSEDDVIASESAEFFIENGSAPVLSEKLAGSEHGTDILDGEQGARIKELIIRFINDNGVSKKNTDETSSSSHN